MGVYVTVLVKHTLEESNAVLVGIWCREDVGNGRKTKTRWLLHSFHFRFQHFNAAWL